MGRSRYRDLGDPMQPLCHRHCEVDQAVIRSGAQTQDLAQFLEGPHPPRKPTRGLRRSGPH